MAKILVLSDIHGNYPALTAIARKTSNTDFDAIINCGDSIVYGPFPNETLNWLKTHHTISIIGNTDKKIIKLLNGKDIKKPRNPDKKIMYSWTASILTRENQLFLKTLASKASLLLSGYRIGIFHGSPTNPDEFLFQNSPKARFASLAEKKEHDIIISGHSHTPYLKKVNNVFFINPGSVGRMFDSNPDASYAIITIHDKKVEVEHFRTPYNVDMVVAALRANSHPSIYEEMFLKGQKLN